MRPFSALHRKLLVLLLAFVCDGVLFGQSSSIQPSTLNAPTPTSLSGPSPLVSTVQSARETLTLPSGSLDLSIPIISFPQKGGRSIPFSFVYSTNSIYSLKQTAISFSESSTDASACQDDFKEMTASIGWVRNARGPFYGAVYVNLPSLSADRTFLGENKRIAGRSSCGYVYTDNAPFCLQGWAFKDWSGSSHTFEGYSFCNSDAMSLQSGNPPPVLAGTPVYSTDGAGYQLDLRNAADLIVRGPDGVVYHFPAGPQDFQSSGYGSLQDDTQFSAYANVFTEIVDPNGNVITATPQSGSYLITDTVGRQITIGAGGFSVSWQQQSSPTGTSQTATASLSQETFSSATADFPATDDTCVQKYSYSDNGPTITPASPPSGLHTETYQSLTLPDGTNYRLTFNLLGQLSRIDYPTGGYTRYDYAKAGETVQLDQGDMMCTKTWRSVIAKHVCTLATGGCAPSAPLSTASACQAGVSGGEATTCYNGYAGQYYWGDLTETDPQGNQITHGFQPNAGPQPPSNLFRNPDEVSTEVKSPSGQVLRSTQVVPNPDGSTCAFPLAFAMNVNAQPPWCSRTTVINDVSPAVSSTETTHWWLPGLPLSSIARDFSGAVIATTNNTFMNTGIYALGTGSAAPTTLVNVLDHVRARTTTDGVTGLQINSTNTYDSVGNLMRVDTSPTGAATASTTYQRDSSGNIVQVSDPMEVAGQHTGSTSMGYSSQTISGCPQNPGPGLPTSLTDALGHTTIQAYYDSGRPACTQDANGQVTRVSYDSLGRATEMDDPDGGKTTTSYPPTIPFTVTQTVHQDATHNPSQQTVLDGFGRTSQHILLSPDEGQTCTETFYDSVGHVSGVNDPRIGCLGSLAPNASVQYQYDALGRKIMQTNEDGTFARWSYSGVVTDFFDEASNHSQRTFDAFGRLVKVLEPDASNSPSLGTSYQYDGFGNLQSVAQTGVSGESSRLRSFTYDGLLRLLTATNPETGPICYGIWSGGSAGAPTCQGGYDLNGNLLSKTDGRGTTTYAYDAVNRLLSKSYTDGTPSACLRYDVGASGAIITNGMAG